jgi:beta-glucanase (GH16 family)
MNSLALMALAWLVHSWSGYQPLAKVTDENVDGRSVKRLCEVKGKYGGCIYTTPRQASRRGDVVHAVFEAKGSGKGFATVARYTEKNHYNQTSTRAEFDLTAEWKRYEFDFYIDDGTSGETAKIDFLLGVEKDGEVYFANADYEIERRIRDNFEGPAPHAGGAEIVQGNIAPGLLSLTGLGVIATDKPRAIELEKTTFSLPVSGANAFFESSVRLYSFGRTLRKDATLDVRFAGDDGGRFALRIVHDAKDEMLKCSLMDKVSSQRTLCGRLNVPYKALPADFVLSAAITGEVKLEVKSLADSSYEAAKGNSRFFKNRTGKFTTSMLYTPRDGQGELVIDEYSLGRANVDITFAPVTMTLNKDEEFDPVKAGWPLVFADEFDGDKVDTNKWECVRNPSLAFIEDGKLHIRTDWNKKGDALETSSLWSNEGWTYGYFESRLRFTKNSGWWAAFWLCTRSCGNPFKDGFEIDIFEDYYTRCDKPDGVHRPILDHNLHMFGSGVLKSWNYRSTLPGSLDDFYVLGCKWTPFEISYYLNGKLISSSANHSKHKSVTFDAIAHGAGFSPLRAIVSGQIMNESWFCHDTTGFKFPEDFVVDYVRVYAFPDKGGPSVSIKSNGRRNILNIGEKIRLDVDAKKASDGADIKAVYLFDSGYLLDYKTEPPYVFDVGIDEKYYGATRYMRPGRSGKVTPLKGTGIHIFAAYVLDSKGRYSYSKDPVEIVVGDIKKSTPYLGNAQKIPGVIKCGLYDNGGVGVAYGDNTDSNLASTTFRTNEWVDAASEMCIGGSSPGEWLTYTVDIAQSGVYRAVFTFGTPQKGKAGLVLFLDGERIGHFDCPAHDAPHWGCDTQSVIEALQLPSGRHRLTILLEGKYNFSTLEFTKVK